ncbi:hypothetical protein Dfri01_23300 [Dyadobacter frigoris]|nr:hypothetical protein Dfri01_23300 [Dyadobacter frigoris]
MPHTKKQHFLEAGAVCNYYGFILTGSVRYYYVKDGAELTGYFNYENEFIGAYKSFLTGNVALNNIQALEDSEIILVSIGTEFGICFTTTKRNLKIRIRDSKSYLLKFS